MYCLYYQATVLRKKAWFVVGSFRNEDIAFVRALDSTKNLFEFFVPDAYKEHFLSFMNYLQKNGYVLEFEEKPNRLKEKLEA